MPSPADCLPADFLAQVTERLTTAIWVFDFDKARVIQANSAALQVWDAESEADLCARDLAQDMSPGVRKRLQQYQVDLIDPKRSFNEVWTLHPNGSPVTLNVCFRGITLPDGRLALLCEGTAIEATAPKNIRSTQALLHTAVRISMFSKAGDVLYLNPAARSTRTELELGLVDRFYSHSEGTKFLETLQTEPETKTVARVVTAKGVRWHEISGSRCKDSVTGAEAFLISELDVTELKEAEKRAEAADRAKSAFLANMSHELRTPLNAIIGFSDFILSGKVTGDAPAKHIEYVADINESGQHLLRLINDVLDLAKVETGEMSVFLEPLGLEEIFETVERIMTPHATQKGVTLTVNPFDPAIMIQADTLRFRQVLMNLLSNAIKFTDAGGQVTLQANQCGQTVAISIRDTGIGMTEEEVKDSIKPFRQVDSSMTRRFEGTGLGLPLSKNLVEAQGGSLKIESEIEKGTEVTLSLPAADMRRVARAKSA